MAQVPQSPSVNIEAMAPESSAAPAAPSARGDAVLGAGLPRDDGVCAFAALARPQRCCSGVGALAIAPAVRPWILLAAQDCSEA